jgi:bifunctional non-homologous end joining protein LigD
MSERERIKAGRRAVEISSPGKLLFEEPPLSKSALAHYYRDVAESILPHLRDRPIHTRRYPGGIGAPGFVHKAAAEGLPEWVRTERLPKHEGGEIEQIVVADAATMVYLVGQNAVTLHGWLSRVDAPECPDQLIIDLDPSSDDFEQVRAAARIVRDVFDVLGLPAYLKTTGSRGLHVLTPLDCSQSFEVVRELGRSVAAMAAEVAPDRLTDEVRKAKREGRLFVDWMRNGYAQTAVVPYAVRARPGAPVAMPIEWGELARVGPRDWTVANARRRIARKRDPWHGLRRRARSAAPPLARARRFVRVDSG